VSLIVGGIGIMNIMLVNVAERQREVGIRKAIGATNSHVINQFLIESCLIGLAGGILGYAIGLATAYAIGLYLPFTPALEWQVAALSIGIATITGILFGIYPAIRAAKKDPIESLRY
jgi:ABC-type antimicrobial peptide transport system permease subunit